MGALLVGCSQLVSAPLATREPRERGDDVVRALAEFQQPGEPVVAADQRSATALDHYVRVLEPDLRPDVVLPPDDAPADADRVWLLRRIMDGAPEPTDDDEILTGAGLAMSRELHFPGGKTDFVLQLWER
jgi:mannosyltransferase